MKLRKFYKRCITIESKEGLLYITPYWSNIRVKIKNSKYNSSILNNKKRGGK